MVYYKGLVSIIIVNWNGKHFLKDCLSSVYKQSYENIEVIFVDNASKDGSIEFVKENFPEVKIIENNKNYGFAIGNSIGLKFCNGEYIYLLNNDTELHSETIQKYVNAIGPQNVAGVCGKILSLTNRDKCIFTLPKIHSRTGKAIWINDDSPITPVDYLSGCSMILKREIIDKMGFLDKTYFAYFEETDLCARIIRAGYDLIYVPDAYTWHKEMGSTPTWFNRYYMMRNQFRFIIKNFDLKYIPYALKENIKALLSGLKNRHKDKKTTQSPTDKADYNLKWLVVKGIMWNIVHLPHTIYCRRRDFKLIGPQIRSYNENLPLRNIKE